LAVEPGELVAVLGASGSGKSTLLRAIAGLEDVASGRVLIGGEDVTRLAPARRGVAMVFQSFALFPHMTVERNIAFGLKARGEPTEAVRTTAEALGLGDKLDRRPGELSGGERQRVALARALTSRPRVLLLDEPLSNLDAQLRVSTRGEIRRVQERTGVTTLHVTHDQVEALALGHRVAVLRDGRLEQLGTPDDVWERPATAWVARFVGTPPMNLVPAERGLRGFRAEDAVAVTDPDGEYVFELAERVGADVLWHLRRGEDLVAVRASGATPEPGERLRADVARERWFDRETGRAL
jgi:sn-glycerol 3-phosphate transport system ATP-binding protein